MSGRRSFVGQNFRPILCRICRLFVCLQSTDEVVVVPEGLHDYERSWQQILSKRSFGPFVVCLRV